MKHIHHLSTAGLVGAIVVAIVIGEAIAWYVTKQFDLRFPAFTVAVLCTGLVAATVSIFYDGHE